MPNFPSNPQQGQVFQDYIFLGSQWRNQKAVQLANEMAEVAWREEMEMM